MTGRGPRAGGGRRPSAGAPEARDGEVAAEAARRGSLVRICDLAGRPRGTGFVADDHGTVVTSHEAVDGLARLVLHGADDRSCVVSTAGRRDPAAGPGPRPGTHRRARASARSPSPYGTASRLERMCGSRRAAGARRACSVRPTSRTPPRTASISSATPWSWRSARTGSDALRLGGGAAGGPVLDRTTGAVLGVLGTALLPRRAAENRPDTARPGSHCRCAPAPGQPGPSRRPPRPQRGDRARVRRRPQPRGRPGTDGHLDRPDGPPGAWRHVAGLRTACRRVRSSRSNGPTGTEVDGVHCRPRDLGRRPRPGRGPGTGRTTELAALAARRHRTRNRPPPCGCAAPTCATRTPPWRTRSAARWIGRAALSPRRARTARPG